ncbi:hypothetical protein SCUCBS95973_002896 [Sporothrix curviconia]|uniref:FAD-binding domain-containing protein n=1 Tax=Sporothrix curviconia TaxID=1260050 RepID=A0ABP0BAT4_9PEZI
MTASEAATTAKADPWVIIVGAGPAGLLLALLLGQQSIPVQVVELADGPDERPRATHYSAPANHELRRAGILDEIQSQGFLPNGVSWRKLDTTYLAGLDNTIPDNKDDSLVCLPLHKLARVILAAIEGQPSIKISWGHKVLDVGQQNGSSMAWVDVESATGKSRLQAPFVVGCDGANSQVRKSLFGSSFPGFTWDEQIVATNTYYDFDKYGYHDANFIIHPEHWYMAARISKDGLWRITYGELTGLTHEELVARQPMKFQKFLPGHEAPEAGAWKLANISPYKVHQRLAEKMAVGHICLVADAAHLCNPFGGMGLTGGIVDAGNLADCLIGIYQGKADDSILEKYSEVRREKYNTIINPISSANIRRLFAQDPETALQDDAFLRLLKDVSADEAFATKLQLEIKAIMHDFTQYYK